MKLSTRGRYGLRAMYDLALRYGEGPVSLNSIADRQMVSLPYLEQLMAKLRRAGLASSSRGAQGGYELAKPPEEITVGDIVRVMEGPFDRCNAYPATLIMTIANSLEIAWCALCG